MILTMHSDGYLASGSDSRPMNSTLRWRSSTRAVMCPSRRSSAASMETVPSLSYSWSRPRLVSIARSNPTAFQAVRFERPVRPSDNGEDGGIPTKGARGRRFEVTPDLVYEISLQDGDRKDGRACARRDTTDMRGAGSSDYARSDLAGPHPHACNRASHI